MEVSLVWFDFYFVFSGIYLTPEIGLLFQLQRRNDRTDDFIFIFLLALAAPKEFSYENVNYRMTA